MALGSAPWAVLGRLGEAGGPGTWALQAGRSDRHRLRIGHELPVGQRRCVGRVLEQPVEQQAAGAGVAAVESEAELLQIRLQMVDVDTALVGAQQPSLAQRCDSVHRGQ